MDFLDAPSYKVEVKDVRKAQEKDTDRTWTLSLHSKDLAYHSSATSSISQLFKDNPPPDKEMTLNLCSVWLQGTVVDIIESQPPNPSILRFADATGEAQVHNYHSLPGGDSDLTKGAYVGVIGQIWTNSPHVIIKGSKIMNMNLQKNSAIIKDLWPDEILMDRAFLLGLVEPDESKS